MSQSERGQELVEKWNKFVKLQREAIIAFEEQAKIEIWERDLLNLPGNAQRLLIAPIRKSSYDKAIPELIRQARRTGGYDEVFFKVEPIIDERLIYKQF